jgi:hypothetical protein
MRFVGKLLTIVLAVGLAGCQTSGPAAHSAAKRTTAHASTARPAVPAKKTDVVMGVGF